MPWFKLALLGLVLFLVWLLFLDMEVRDRFEGKRWQLPAQVYAAPLEIYPGAPLSYQSVVQTLDDLGYQRVERPRSPGEYAVASQRLEVYLRSFQFPDALQPASQVSIRFEGQAVTSLALGGRPVEWIRLDPLLFAGIYPENNEDRVLIRYEDAPALLQQSLLAVEDRHFFDHHGVSPRAIARAMVANIRSGGIVQGGSTITQQLVKNLYLDADQTIWRKANEALMALLLDFHYEKEEILEAYLNEVFLGQRGKRAVHGFAQGSLFYFAKPLSDLSTDQIALLVGLVKGASWYDPRRHPERAKARRDVVLGVMAGEGLITDKELAIHAGRPLGVTRRPATTGNRFPAFLDHVRESLAREYTPADLREEGLRIFTTLQPSLQQAAESALAGVTRSLEKNDPRNQGLQGAMVVTDQATGELAAIVGSRDGGYSGFNRALAARRQVGSLVKPFVAVAALEADRYSLGTILEDESFQVRFENDKTWTPRNYDGKTHGKILMVDALAYSYNLAFARLGLDLGIDLVIDTLKRLGLEKAPPSYPSLLLGALDLTPIQVNQLYQNLLGGGFAVPLRSIRTVLGREGGIASRYGYQASKVIEPEVAFQIEYALSEVMRYGTGASGVPAAGRNQGLIGKTGTTNDNRDSWFVGADGRYLATVWMGQDDNESTGVTGASGSLKVWRSFLEGQAIVPRTLAEPENIQWAWIDPESGYIGDEGCPAMRRLPFESDHVPTTRHPCATVESPLESVRKWWQGVFD